MCLHIMMLNYAFELAKYKQQQNSRRKRARVFRRFNILYISSSHVRESRITYARYNVSYNDS